MKKLFNSPKTLIALVLVFITVLTNRKTINAATEKAIAKLLFDDNYAEQWQIRSGSVVDGDTLKVSKGNEELTVRLCGIDAPQMQQQFGIESRDYLQSLIAKSNGTIHILPIKDNRSEIPLVEAWIPIKPDYEGQIHLNTAMLEAGLAYHYEKYSSNCESAENLVWAEKIGKDEKLGVWNDSYQKPRKLNKVSSNSRSPGR